MNIRKASCSEIDVGSTLVYQKNPSYEITKICSNGAARVRVLGTFGYSRDAPYDSILYVVEKYDGSIILASSQQLFIVVS